MRVIYYFHSELMPVYLITLFAKNERGNLSEAERNELAKLVEFWLQYGSRGEIWEQLLTVSHAD